MAGFLKVLLRNVLDGPSTDPFPLGETFTPRRFRGQVRVNPDLCMGCGMCMHVCAAGAIKIQKRSDRTGYDILVWHNSCCLCASCRHYCPVGAITLSNDWHNAHPQEQKFQWMEAQFVPYVACTHCGAPMRPLPKAIADNIYINNKDVDIDHILGLCPACRQMEDAKRTAAVVEKMAAMSAEAEAQSSAADTEKTPSSEA